jgi:hypothetical protein
VIVKKVQTNKRAAPKSRAVHVRDLCDYIAGANAGESGEKVEHRGAVNLLNLDHSAQVEEMADLAEMAQRSPQPVQHWILSWRQGERPTPAQAAEAARVFLTELGLDAHQCIYALHRNTDNYHLHLAVNRVHPETERVVTVNGGFDIEVAHRAVARIEHVQGWQREARGRYRVRGDGDLQREPQPARQAERQPTTRARDFENRTGQKSAQRLAIDDAAGILRRARSWDELHARLAGQAMRLEKKGSGAILWVGEVPVKASTAGRDCSLSALEKRLGTYVPGAPHLGAPSRTPEPVDPAAQDWKAYAAERRTHFRVVSQHREQLTKQHRQEREAMLARHRAERRECLELDWRGRGVALNAVRSMLAARQAREKAEARERQRADLASCRQQNPRWPTFETWLRERRNPELAERWRFRDRAPAVIIGDREGDARLHDIRAFYGDVRGWEVAYRRIGSRDAPSFVDRGREIRIHDLQRDSVLAALQLSAQKWGTFQVFGSDNYKRLCADLAAEHGFRITNPELQQVIALSRERRHQAPPTRDATLDLPRRSLEPPLDPRPRGRGRGFGR